MVNKPFSEELYKQSDGPAKFAVCRYLKSQGWATNTKETYGVDIRTFRTGYDGWPEQQLHEVEVKHGWKGDWPASWLDVRIPERKIRLVGDCIWQGWALFFWVLSDDLSQAWVVNDFIFEHAPKEERANRLTTGEKFAIIPVSKCRLIKLKGDQT